MSNKSARKHNHTQDGQEAHTTTEHRRTPIHSSPLTHMLNDDQSQQKCTYVRSNTFPTNHHKVFCLGTALESPHQP